MKRTICGFFVLLVLLSSACSKTPKAQPEIEIPKDKTFQLAKLGVPGACGKHVLYDGKILSFYWIDDKRESILKNISINEVKFVPTNDNRDPEIKMDSDGMLQIFANKASLPCMQE